MNELKITRAANKPLEIRMRRTGVSPPIVVPDLMPGQRLLTAEKSYHVDLGEHSAPVPRIYLDLDSKGRVAPRFDWYGRDGDLDGTVQDGSPFERRSRALGHLRYTRNMKKRRALELLRLRDMPFPFEPATPSSSSVQAQPAKQVAPLDLHAKVREHNAEMRRAGKPEWSMTNPATLAKIAIRAGEKDAQERIELFLGVLANGRPSDRTYVGDNDLLKKHHPWRVNGMSEALMVKHIVPPLEREDLHYADLHGALFKAGKGPSLGNFSGGASIGGGRRLSVDGPGIRDAVAKGAVVDELGHLRCPPLTPGAMQFTNWKLEGCGSVRKTTRKKIQLTVDELKNFTDFGGSVVSSADIAKYTAEARGQTIGATPSIRRRKAVAARLRRPAPGIGDEVQKTTLGAMIEKSRKDAVQINLAGDAAPIEGISVPRSEMGLTLSVDDVLKNGVATGDGEARIVEWLNAAMSEPPRPGAIGTIATITQVQPPYRPREADQPPLSGRAQELADQANGDFAKFMELLDNEEVIIFDFETTGMGADGNVPVEVAAQRVRNGKVIEKLHLYMNPERPLGDWSSKNLQDDAGNRLTNEWLAGQPPIADQMKALTDFMGESIIIAHNAPFDVGILDEHLQKNNIDFKPAGVLDTLVLSRQVIPKGETPNYKLPAMAEYFGVNLKEWHTAWADTAALTGVLNGLAEYGRTHQVDSSVLDSAAQAERYAVASQKYAEEMSVFVPAMDAYEKRWGTKSGVMRMDIHDVFDEKLNGSQRERQQAFDAVVDMASQEGEPSVLRLSDGAAIDVAEVMAQPVQSTVSTISPATARIQDAKTRLEAAFKQLEGADNMNLDAFDSKQLKAMMAEWQKVPGFEWIDPENPDHLWLAVDQGASNLLQLVEGASPEERAVWRRWYEAANQYSIDLGNHHEVSTETAAAVIAVLSPTQDWNGNIALADHMMSLLNDKNFTVDDALAERIAASMVASYRSKRGPEGSLTKKIAKTEDELTLSRSNLVELMTTNASPKAVDALRKQIDENEKKLKELHLEFDTPPVKAADLKGKKLDQLDEDALARAVRFHAQFDGGKYMKQPPVDGKGDSLRMYSMAVEPDASFTLGHSDTKVRVQSTAQYKKAIAVYKADKNRKANLNVIDKQLGRGSKVRSFYNNILQPNDTKYADVTADTHQFGAATLVPVAASHNVLDAVFKSSNATGASAAYPLVRAMTVLAASRWNAETGDDLAPRALQSVAWEKIRQLIPTRFPDAKGEMKSDSSLKSYITDTAAQIARLTSGPKPKRRDLAGRQLDLLDDLSTRLQRSPKRDRAAVLEAWRLEHKLPRLRPKDRLSKEVKVKDGKKFEVDKETGEIIEIPAEVTSTKKK